MWFQTQEQELTKAVLEISTPPQTLPLPLKAGKKSFCMVQLLSPGPDLQLLTPLLWKEIVVMNEW